MKEQITAKFRYKINLTPQIDLVLKEDIQNIENVIIAEEDSDGAKFIKIRSEEGFRHFKGRSPQ